MKTITGRVFDVKECAVHDGPGLRTTVFLKGCPLRCAWCQNPEGQAAEKELLVKEMRCKHCGNCLKPCNHAECAPFGRCVHACPERCLAVSGEDISVETLCTRLLRDKPFFDASGGGVTFSGGEPLAQKDFLFACLNDLADMHTVVETCGHTDEATFRTLIEKADLVIMDVKLMDDACHRQYTGVSNERILQNAAILRDSGRPHLFRTPLIPGITDTEENLAAVRAFVGASPWETIPYNAAAGAKYPFLGRRYFRED